MSKGLIYSLVIARQKERPDIHGKRGVAPSGQTGHSEAVYDKVRDLKENIPDISQRELSMYVGIGTKQVRKALESEPEERWTSDDNEASAAAELAALQAAHPGGYEDHPDAANEYPTAHGLLTLTTPPHSDTPRLIDQSHTIPRAITLATVPFDWAA